MNSLFSKQQLSGPVSGIHLAIPLLIIFFVSCSSSSVRDDDGKYPLWKLEGDHNTVWLLGSVHMLPESAHPFPSAFQDAYNDADKLIFEIKVDQENPMSMLMGLANKIMLTQGKTLEDVLSPETWDMLEPRLDDVAETLLEAVKAQLGDAGGGGMGMLNKDMLKSQLLRMQPWFVGFLLASPGSNDQYDDYRPELGPDLFYMNRAKEDGKEIGSFETIEEQLGFFQQISGTDPDAFIQSMLNQTSVEGNELDGLVDAWKRGDMATLDKMVNGALKADPSVYKTLLVDRNKRWVPQIIDLLNDDQNYMIVVGAGHLVGDQSVIALLREQGYRVVRQ